MTPGRTKGAETSQSGNVRVFSLSLSLLQGRWPGPLAWASTLGCENGLLQPRCGGWTDGEKCKQEVDSINDWPLSRDRKTDVRREKRRSSAVSLSVLDTIEKAEIPRTQKSAHGFDVLCCVSELSVAAIVHLPAGTPGGGRRRSGCPRQPTPP